MENLNNNWKALDVKTKLAYISAIAALIVGFGLTIAGFCVPPVGLVSDSVLWILGQTLVFAGSIFGVALYTTGSVANMKREIQEYLKKES